MKRLIPLVAVMISLAVLGFTANAQARGEKRGGFLKRGHLMQVIKELNLTEDQQAKLKEMKKTHKGEMKSARESMKESMKALREAMQSEASKETILSKYQTVEASRARLGRARIGLMLDVREILTADQRKQFRELLEKRPGKSDHDEGE